MKINNIEPVRKCLTRNNFLRQFSSCIVFMNLPNLQKPIYYIIYTIHTSTYYVLSTSVFII